MTGQDQPGAGQPRCRDPDPGRSQHDQAGHRHQAVDGHRQQVGRQRRLAVADGQRHDVLVADDSGDGSHEHDSRGGQGLVTVGHRDHRHAASPKAAAAPANHQVMATATTERQKARVNRAG